MSCRPRLSSASSTPVFEGMGCLPRNEAHSALHCRKALLLGYIWCPDKAARDEHVNINPADFLYLCNRPFLHCHLTKRTKKADMERNLVGILRSYYSSQ